jgi:hypothetical protein
MAALPLRKISAVVTLAFTLLVIVWCLVKIGDVPPGAVTLLVGLNGISVGGYIGSSSYEAVRTPRRFEEGEIDDERQTD